MLKHISVENYALIRKLDISFTSGFNVITGETGAGKSILVGAVSLLLGQRADISVLFDKDEKCVVEGVFDISELQLQDFFSENELDYENELIIRREITPQAKSRGFINDTPVNLNVMKLIGNKLIDIHSQHHNLLINESDFQINIVDQYAANFELKSEYLKTYNDYKRVNSQLSNLITKQSKASADKDYYSFLYNEIELIKLLPNEIENLEQEFKILNNSEEIKNALYNTFSIIEDDELSVISKLSDLKNSLSTVSKYHNGADDIHTRLESCYIELKDIARESQILSETIQFDVERMAFIESRLDIINRLCLKHKVDKTEQLINLMFEFEQKLNSIKGLEDELIETENQLNIIQQKLKKLANDLSQSRLQQLKPISDSINNVLKQLGMVDAEIVFNSNIIEHYTERGIDDIQILFTANKGHIAREIEKVVSGGELSRIMLAIKNLISTRNLIPIVIFDEIDTGVSGDIAAKVALIMKNMSNNMQIIAISHLPQIAAKADTHFWIYKETEHDITSSKIKLLNQNERIEEIAKMISDENISSSAIQTAKELLNLK